MQRKNYGICGAGSVSAYLEQDIILADRYQVCAYTLH